MIGSNAIGSCQKTSQFDLRIARFSVHTNSFWSVHYTKTWNIALLYTFMVLYTFRLTWTVLGQPKGDQCKRFTQFRLTWSYIRDTNWGWDSLTTHRCFIWSRDFPCDKFICLLSWNTLPPNGFLYKMVIINLFHKKMCNTGHVNALH